MPKTALFSLHGHSRPSKQTVCISASSPPQGVRVFLVFLHTYLLGSLTFSLEKITNQLTFLKSLKEESATTVF